MLKAIRQSVHARRGFATALVLWAVAIASVLLVSLQVSAWRQAASGREEVARVRARWAARAGLETMIAALASQSQQAEPVGPATLMANLAAEAEGTLQGAMYLVGYTDAGELVPGVRDAGALLNINLMTREDLMLLSGMTEDIADAIQAWIGKTSDTGVSIYNDDYYRSLPMSYIQRNTPIRSLQELELVAGVTPELVRGEDWNLNGILDSNENDGDLSWPPDNADGVLDRGWSAIVGAAHAPEALAPDGQARIDLLQAQAGEIASLLRVENTQADAILAYGKTEGATLEEFLRTDLNTLNQRAQQAAQQNQQGGTGTTGQTGGQTGGNRTGLRGGARTRTPTIRSLTAEQVGTLYEQCTIGPVKLSAPGKVNLNTVSRETLDYLQSLSREEADAIIAQRDSMGGEMRSIVDLMQVQGMTQARLAQLAPMFTVRSTVFEVTARGRDAATGATVEITAQIDRSRIPIVIRSLTVR